MPDSHKIILLIEDNPSARGAPLINEGKPRQLEYACIATQTPRGPSLTVKAVRDANTHEDISDPDQLPPLQVVIEAARLYDWSWTNQQVFSPGIPMINGMPFKAPKMGKGRRKRAPKPESEDDLGAGV